VGKANFYPTNAAKTNTVKVTMEGDLLPEEIQKLKETLTWEVEVSGKTFTSRSGPHTVYVTYDAPKSFPDREEIDFDDPGKPGTFPLQPLGVTLKRLDKAVELAEPGDTTEEVERTVFAFNPAAPAKLKETKVKLNRPHVIVRTLMRVIKDYELEADASLKAVNHPVYMNSGVGGAWPITDYPDAKAECQAIVRWVGSMLTQLGVPGTAETFHVFAKATAPFDADESPKKRGYGGTLALTDGPIADSDVGKVFPPSHKVINGRKSMGFNEYEACLKFTFGGLSLYYGGGAGVYDSKEAVLRAFTALVRVERAPWPSAEKPTETGVKITKILARFGDPK
jgi:hypothetical protein